MSYSHHLFSEQAVRWFANYLSDRTQASSEVLQVHRQVSVGFVRWEISWGRWRWKRLRVQMGSAPASVLCRPAVQDCGVYLQHEPEAWKSATAVENLLCGTNTKDPSPWRLQQLQTSCSHFTPDEDPRAAGPRSPTLSCGSFYGPLQFASQPGIRVDNTIIFLLHRSLSHLAKPGSTMRIIFLVFAFNTIPR